MASGDRALFMFHEQIQNSEKLKHDMLVYKRNKGNGPEYERTH